MIMTLLHVITASWRSYKTVFRLWKSSKAQIWHHEVEMRVEISTLFRIRCFFWQKLLFFENSPEMTWFCENRKNHVFSRVQTHFLDQNQKNPDTWSAIFPKFRDFEKFMQNSQFSWKNVPKMAVFQLGKNTEISKAVAYFFRLSENYHGKFWLVFLGFVQISGKNAKKSKSPWKFVVLRKFVKMTFSRGYRHIFWFTIQKIVCHDQSIFAIFSIIEKIRQILENSNLLIQNGPFFWKMWRMIKIKIRKKGCVKLSQKIQNFENYHAKIPWK